MNTNISFAPVAYAFNAATTKSNAMDVRAKHERNDETLERIYIGRRFKNDTERLEKLFEMYTKMTANADKRSKTKKAAET